MAYDMPRIVVSALHRREGFVTSFASKYTWLIWLMLNERKSRSSILALQARKLKKLVQHAYDNVPFYRQPYDEAGVHPDDIQSTQDLPHLPTITKRDFHVRP